MYRLWNVFIPLFLKIAISKLLANLKTSFLLSLIETLEYMTDHSEFINYEELNTFHIDWWKLFIKRNHYIIVSMIPILQRNNKFIVQKPRSCEFFPYFYFHFFIFETRPYYMYLPFKSFALHKCKFSSLANLPVSKVINSYYSKNVKNVRTNCDILSISSGIQR